MLNLKQAESDPRVVVITGAAGALGQAYVRGFASRKWAIVLVDRVDAGAEAEHGEALGARGSLAVQADVSDEEAVNAMAAAAWERFGRIDALVNNAGRMTQIVKRPLEEITVEEWDETFAVDVRGTWLCVKAVAPLMKQQRYGRIVNTSSMTPVAGVVGFPQYVASKAAIVGLTRALARELGEYGIAVNTVSPDYIPHESEFTTRQPEMAARVADERCFKRDQLPDDVVGTVVFLASEDAAFITGQNIWVNGGRFFS